jgi:D-alanyl-D-alanine carboxypeptidase
MSSNQLGLSQTYFINESGLDEGNVSGGYGSAEDISKLINKNLKQKIEMNMIDQNYLPKKGSLDL